MTWLLLVKTILLKSNTKKKGKIMRERESILIQTSTKVQKNLTCHGTETEDYLKYGEYRCHNWWL